MYEKRINDTVQFHTSYVIHHTLMRDDHTAHGFAVAVAERVEIGAVGECGSVESEFVQAKLQVDRLCMYTLS